MPRSQITDPTPDPGANRRYLRVDLRVYFRVAAAALAGFFVGTACWIGLALSSAGDFFATGHPLPLLVIVVGATGGAIGGYRTRSRSVRRLVAVAAVACGVFWVVAPNGWWALPPPTPTEVRPP